MGKLTYYKKRLSERVDIFKIKNFGLISGEVDFFFIVSAGRSGSTMLRRQLIENAEIGIPPESEDLIPKLVKSFVKRRKSYIKFVDEAIQLISETDCLKVWSLNIEEVKLALLELNNQERKIDIIIHLIYSKALQGHSGKFLIGDKTPMLNDYLRLISVVFPKGKLVYVIRDGRAVVNSYVQSRGYSIEKAINRWKSSIQNYDRFLTLFENRNCLVRYENFVNKTDKELLQILKFLGKKRSISTVKFEELGDTGLSHHENVKKPVNKDSMSKWKTELQKVEIEIIDEALNAELKKYNYI